MDWLQLTEEDIERAQQEAKATPPMPGALRIGASDIASKARLQCIAAPIRLTEQDLAPLPAQPLTSLKLADLEELMFGLINTARRTSLARWLGNPDLQWNEGLAAAARGHSADMLKRQYFEHKSPEGLTAADRISRAGIRYIACGENIGVAYGDVSHGPEGIHAIHNAFMDQPLRLNNHRGNLLNPIWSHVGVGLAYHTDGVLIATQSYISWPVTR